MTAPVWGSAIYLDEQIRQRKQHQHTNHLAEHREQYPVPLVWLEGKRSGPVSVHYDGATEPPADAKPEIDTWSDGYWDAESCKWIRWYLRSSR